MKFERRNKALGQPQAITVGICSIGSGVGQSVIDSCRLSSQSLYTIGLGNNPLAFGLYECDDHAYLPSYYDNNYIDALLKVCLEKSIDVLIPGHDDEALLVAENIDKFIEIDVEVIVAGADLIQVCRAKETMADSFPAVSDLFVESFTVDGALALEKNGGLYFPLFAKPRDGYASKGIAIVDSVDALRMVDRELILQEVAIPHSGDPFHSAYIKSLKEGRNLQAAEISVQLLADQNGEIKAQCATYNKLNNGIPIEILPYDNGLVNTAISRLIPLLQEKGLKGPVNIQGRLTDSGFKIFEINPRFTGITGLRAAMGFNEVDACVRHWVTGLPIQRISLNPHVFGIRQTANKAIHLSRNSQVEQLHSKIHDDKPQNDQKPVVLVTGSTGTIGKNLVAALLQQKTFNVWTLDRFCEKASQINPGVSCSFDWDDYEAGKVNLGSVDKIVHLASARPFHEPKDIAESLTRGMRLFSDYAAHGAGEIVYASSQSVYGSQAAVCTEDQIPEPATLYAQHKFTLEQHLAGIKKTNPGISTVSLRIGTVTGNDPTIRKYEALARLTLRAVDEQIVELYGGSQTLGRIHYLDVVAGILKVVEQRTYACHDVFNLGAKESYTLKEIANKVIGVVERLRPEKRISLVEKEAVEGVAISHAIDSSRFMKAYAWKPEYSIESIIESMVGE